jgi:hypothetical protein
MYIQVALISAPRTGRRANTAIILARHVFAHQGWQYREEAEGFEANSAQVLQRGSSKNLVALVLFTQYLLIEKRCQAAQNARERRNANASQFSGHRRLDAERTILSKMATDGNRWQLR